MIWGWDTVDLVLLEVLEMQMRKREPEASDERISEMVSLAWGIHLEHMRGDGG